MVREHIDTIDSLLARYVAGTLPEPARVLVESHMEMNARSRRFVSELEALAGEALFDIAPVELTDRDDMLEAIFASRDAEASIPIQVAARKADADRPLAGLPTALRNFIGYEIDSIPWRSKMPGLREFDLGEFDGCHASMFWLRPGRPIPAHTHGGCEISLVLQGAFSDGIGRYGPGDISVADEDVDHRPVAENIGPCIGFAVTDAPLRLTGSFRQIISDLIG